MSSRNASSTATVTPTSVTREAGVDGIGSSGHASSPVRVEIGIGVSLGALVILSAIVAAVVIMKRKRKGLFHKQIQTLPEGHGESYKRSQEMENTEALVHELPGWVSPRELHGQYTMTKVQTDNSPIEMMGSGINWPQ